MHKISSLCNCNVKKYPCMQRSGGLWSPAESQAGQPTTSRTTGTLTRARNPPTPSTRRNWNNPLPVLLLSDQFINPSLRESPRHGCGLRTAASPSTTDRSSRHDHPRRLRTKTSHGWTSSWMSVVRRSLLIMISSLALTVWAP